ncbi:TetR/AcrR family transcriptional regulator [Nocardioides lijunqiniae]|uniref:TetR/AcrR family transcriptional regulator n=1 Tax=Nocardioides lijunqiniae TaxID=2760832 RepID=UPI001877C928|nr:TetR/AcrR family transcriptional regulator [Nocardioides lijunqiniae]
MQISSLTPRRRVILDAALRVLVEQGLRGLTHRAVDRAADLPEGSTSAYLRTRRALQLALTEYVVGRVAEDVDALLQELEDCTPEDPRTIELVLGLFARWLGEQDLALAKVELTMEAARDPELAALLARDRDRVVDIVAEILTGHDVDQAHDRAQTMMASFDGILLSALLRPEGERDELLRRVLPLAMHPLGTHQPAPLP